MTVRRKEPVDKETPDKDEGLMQVVDRTLGTKSFRLAVFALLLSMHPLGRQILSTVGFEFPDERKLTVAADEAREAKSNLTVLTNSLADLHNDVDSLKSDAASLKANYAIINTKLDKLSVDFTGFQVDFGKKKTP